MIFFCICIEEDWWFSVLWSVKWRFVFRIKLKNYLNKRNFLFEVDVFFFIIILVIGPRGKLKLPGFKIYLLKDFMTQSLDESNTKRATP